MKPIIRLTMVMACVAAAAIAVVNVFSQGGSQIVLRSATTSGGGSSTSGNLAVKTSIGEPVGGSKSAGSFALSTGFIAVTTTTNSIGPLNLTKVSSRKTHGSAGMFDLDITSGTAIECRYGGTGNGYNVVFTFSNPVSSCGTASTGTVSHVTGSNECSVAVNAPSGQHITVQLTGVTDSNGSTTNASGTMGVLVGDTNADKFADAVDVAQTKSQSGHAVTQSNFREDVNVDGFIDAVDVALVKSRSGTALSSSSAKPPSSAPKSKPRNRSRNQ